MTTDHLEATAGVAPEAPIACDLLVLPPAARAAHVALAKSLLFVAGQSVTQLPDGLSFELPSSRFDDVARFVANERHCCAHLSFTIEVPRRGAALELRITGAGVREGLSAIVSGPSPTSMSPKRG